MKRVLFLPLLGAFTALGQTEGMPQILFAPPQPGIVATPGEIQQLTFLANMARNEAQQASDKVDAGFDKLYSLSLFSNRVAFVSANIITWGEYNSNMDTNAACSIVFFRTGNAVAGMRSWFIGVWFSTAVNGVPEVISSDTLTKSIVNWDNHPIAGWTIENNVEVNGTIFNPVYVLEVLVPVTQDKFFAKVIGYPLGGGPGAYLRVYEGGVQVGATPGRSLDITICGVRLFWEGGVLLPPPVMEETP